MDIQALLIEIDAFLQLATWVLLLRMPTLWKNHYGYITSFVWMVAFVSALGWIVDEATFFINQYISFFPHVRWSWINFLRTDLNHQANGFVGLILAILVRKIMLSILEFFVKHDCGRSIKQRCADAAEARKEKAEAKAWEAWNEKKWREKNCRENTWEEDEIMNARLQHEVDREIQ